MGLEEHQAKSCFRRAAISDCSRCSGFVSSGCITQHSALSLGSLLSDKELDRFSVLPQSCGGKYPGQQAWEGVTLPLLPRVAESEAPTGDHIFLRGENHSLRIAGMCSRWDGSAMLTQRAASWRYAWFSTLFPCKNQVKK